MTFIMVFYFTFFSNFWSHWDSDHLSGHKIKVSHKLNTCISRENFGIGKDFLGWHDVVKSFRNTSLTIVLSLSLTVIYFLAVDVLRVFDMDWHTFFSIHANANAHNCNCEKLLTQKKFLKLNKIFYLVPTSIKEQSFHILCPIRVVCNSCLLTGFEE